MTTTLATHVGLYRNKRPNFGTRSKLTSVWPHWSKSMQGNASLANLPCPVTAESLYRSQTCQGVHGKRSVQISQGRHETKTALVFSDQYARYPGIVEFTSSTSADYVIPLFMHVFNQYRIPEEIKQIMGPRLMDQSLQILLRNKGSDIKRSPLGGLKRMETWSISFKPSRRVREFQNLKEKLLMRRVPPSYKEKP